jgi:hypothetical protein
MQGENIYPLVIKSLTGVTYHFTINASQTLAQIITMLFLPETRTSAWEAIPIDGVDFRFSLITGERGVSVYDFPLNTPLTDILIEGMDTPGAILYWYLYIAYFGSNYLPFKQKVEQRWNEYYIFR